MKKFFRMIREKMSGRVGLKSYYMPMLLFAAVFAFFFLYHVGSGQSISVNINSNGKNIRFEAQKKRFSLNVEDENHIYKFNDHEENESAGNQKYFFIPGENSDIHLEEDYGSRRDWREKWPKASDESEQSNLGKEVSPDSLQNDPALMEELLPEEKTQNLLWIH